MERCARPLNPAATPFVPSSLGGISYTSEDAMESEEFISQEDLDELEAAEDWVATMANIEEAETEFLIDLALDFAPATRIAEVEAEAAHKQ
ncbi:hypothetical protein Rsub_02778 [Raphidocelis subcapitata]|uniref:Uncharacterized protein n=1 Tax=Raphidocelis subcapitata TaxID=307507 RepID=A0A2V0NWX0_9CHLO|nr:hypothetical protein Rsub_02778 [Raphidocelis subcapitata]|eukprot:GBF90070.1 hypothetical protein Rsub_02778 [Raphidocelis subcapitata]